MIVAFSGGVDSAYLAWAATQVLGPSALCVTADSPSYPDHHRQLALRIAREFGLRHEIVLTAELEPARVPGQPRAIAATTASTELYTRAVDPGRRARISASSSTAAMPTIASDYRPGRQAARERGVRSPLDDADLTKADIRELSRLAGLPTWNEPASACLSSRIPYHSEVTGEKLRMIERAESRAEGDGFSRVPRSAPRHAAHVSSSATTRCLARSSRAMRERIVRELRAVGYQEVTVDPQGYRMGSLNEGVRLRPT